jgi:hypothetical protein
MAWFSRRLVGDEGAIRGAFERVGKLLDADARVPAKPMTLEAII